MCVYIHVSSYAHTQVRYAAFIIYYCAHILPTHIPSSIHALVSIKLNQQLQISLDIQTIYKPSYNPYPLRAVSVTLLL